MPRKYEHFLEMVDKIAVCANKDIVTDALRLLRLIRP
jgi:hypothetical protein